VGGAAAYAYGAQRPTEDIDCVVRRDRENLDRLADALRELRARLRVAGMTDAEARLLPVQIDATTLDMAGMTTWMTDAGPFDVLAGLEAPDGRLVPYEELVARATVLHGAGSPSVQRRWKTSSGLKSEQTGPRTEKRCLSCARFATLGR
jgi:hypothetical protein